MKKNKKVLCIVDMFHPECSANTVCMEELMDRFKKDGCTIDYLSIRFTIENDNIVPYENGNIIKYDGIYSTRFLSKYGKFFHAKTWAQLPVIVRKPVYLLNQMKQPFVDRYGISKKTYKQIVDLLKSTGNDYDIIVSTCYPFTLHIIASQLLNIYKNAKWYPVFLDPFVHNFCLPKKEINKRKKIANKVLEKANKIFMVRGIKEENESRGYVPPYHEKVTSISLPNLKDLTSERKNASLDKISLTYAGVFYKDIRNPKKMFEILGKIGDGFELNLMSRCCEKLVKKLINKTKNIKINNYGYLKREECLKILDDTNILVNLGNTITNQTPSKVFEYIGMGKPIINFYFDEKDTSLFYLKKYPLCYNINVNNYTSEDVEGLREFCLKNKDKKLTYSEATVNLKEELAEAICKKFYNEVNCD